MPFLNDAAGAIAAQLRFGSVLETSAEGIFIGLELDDVTLVLECKEKLDGAVLPGEGDRVLVLPLPDSAGCILVGRLLPIFTPAPAVAGASGSIVSAESCSRLLLEATEELTLQVGEGSITVRKDGRILIKDKDIVSHAERLNRLKGGAVSIN